MNGGEVQSSKFKVQSLSGEEWPQRAQRGAKRGRDEELWSCRVRVGRAELRFGFWRG